MFCCDRGYETETYSEFMPVPLCYIHISATTPNNHAMRSMHSNNRTSMLISCLQEPQLSNSEYQRQYFQSARRYILISNRQHPHIRQIQNIVTRFIASVDLGFVLGLPRNDAILLHETPHPHRTSPSIPVISLPCPWGRTRCFSIFYDAPWVYNGYLSKPLE